MLEQLVVYRDSLDTIHRERFARYVNRKHDACGATSVYRLFWGPLR